MGLEAKLETVNWPAASGEYKVVQVYVDGQSHLLFPRADKKRHAVMLVNMLNALQIPVVQMTIQDEFETRTLPALEGERYRVAGMGRATVDAQQRKAVFYGFSTDYGLYIDSEHLKEIRKLQPDWNIEMGSK